MNDCRSSSDGNRNRLIGRQARFERMEVSMLAHNVFFDLVDGSDEAVAALLAGCKSFLEPHDGVEFFACGARVTENQRDVNDQAFGVGLHIVFADQSAHDAYQVSEAHQNFINKFKPNWTRVRVFDSAW